MNRSALAFASAMVILCFFTESSSKSMGAEGPEKWALVVGVDKHASGAMVTNWAASKAKDFQQFLVNEAGFKPDHINLLLDENATGDNFLANFGDGKLHHAKPDDLVVVYVSGWGSPPEADACGETYFCVYDTDEKRLFASGLAMKFLLRTMKERMQANRVILIVDASYSGSAQTQDVGLRRMPAGASSVVLTSSRANEKSYGGVFTESLLTELKAKGPTAELAEIFPIVRDRTEREVSKRYGAIQKPQLQKTGANELSLK